MKSSNNDDQVRRRVLRGHNDESRTFSTKARLIVSLVGQCVRFAVELLDAVGRFK